MITMEAEDLLSRKAEAMNRYLEAKFGKRKGKKGKKGGGKAGGKSGKASKKGKKK